MQTVRRLYLYAVALISLEVVIWGAIGLLRSIFSAGEIGGGAERLAGALSLILVGVPVFGLHWWLAQRSARQDLDERFSRIRAFFLYAALLGMLIPVAQNTLALVNRFLAGIFNLGPGGGFFGWEQSALDNLVAIVINLLIAAYIFRVTQADWQAHPQGDDLAETRRLYRYIWLFYSLGLVVAGIQSILQFILMSGQTLGNPQGLLVNGLAMLLVGAPLWYFVSQVVIQPSLAQPEERDSLLRLVVLYILAFVSVGSVLVSSALTLNVVLRLVLGSDSSGLNFLVEVARPLSVALPMAAVWVYYGRLLGSELRPRARPPQPAEEKSAAEKPVDLRRAGLRRLYFYVLAAFGLGAALVGFMQLLSLILDLAFGNTVFVESSMKDALAVALANLLVSLPLWLYAWRLMQVDAAQEGEAGDHARRSPIRKAYLFLFLFVGVIGVMVSGGLLLFGLLSAVLGEAPDDLWLSAWQQGRGLLVFGLLLAYHGWVLRMDGRQAARSLAQRHSLFPVLVLVPGKEVTLPEGLVAYGSFADALVGALYRQAPSLPVALHPYTQGVPDESLSAARVVILPADLLVRSPEAIRLWLNGFSGKRIVVPTLAPEWHWVFGSGRSLAALARQTAQAVRQLAEGESISPPREASPWMGLVYLLAVLFALQILLVVITSGLSLLFS